MFTSSSKKKYLCPTASNQEFLPIEQLFQYTGIEKYICLIEKFKVAPDEEIINQTFILDEQLSVIFNYKSPNCFKFEHFKKQPRYVQESSIVYMLEEDKREILYEKWYDFYPHLNDFLIGREYWGRTQNCMKISSDQISRDHSRILYNGLKRQEQMTEMQQLLRSIVKNEARASSKFKQIPESLWENILNYALSKSSYTVKDCESRNGTFVMDYSKIELPLSEKVQYIFQSQEYIVRVNQIITGSASDIFQVINRFIEDQEANFNQNHRTKIVYPNERDALDLLDVDVLHALHFHIDIKQKYRFHFWILSSGEPVTHFIGEGQQIGISYNLESNSYEVSRHGKLKFRSDKWYIAPLDESERVWFRLPPHVQYELKVQNKYKIRLSSTSTLDIEFFNYSN